MTLDRFDRQLSRARRDYVRHSRAADAAESLRAQSRHMRRADQAAKFLIQAQRDAMRAGWPLSLV